MQDFMRLMKEGEAMDLSVGERATGIAKFAEKLEAFKNLIANKAGHKKSLHQYLLKEAESTSDFPTLFGTVLERTLRAKYNLVNATWRQFVKVGTQNDFRTAWDIALYGNRKVLSPVKERGEFKTRALFDGKFTVTPRKFGNAFGLSWEALINDDMGAFADIANDLSVSATQTESQFVTALYACNDGKIETFGASTGANSTLFNASGTHPIDGGTFANLGTLDLTGDNLATTITAMRTQKDFDGNPIQFGRFYLVVPAALEYTALKILSQNLLIATALGSTSAAATSTSENIIAKYPITLIVNPWLDQSGYSHAALQWYVFAEPASSGGDALVVKFLRGHETPEICQKMSDKISLGGAPISPLEGDFDSDTMQYRVRHILGGTVTDPRFAYAQNPTS